MIPLVQWAALASVAAATLATIRLWDRGRWDLGLVVQPRLALREAVAGLGFSVLLIGAAAILIASTTTIRHRVGSGFPLLELVAVFLPAAVHEELLFRGYAFQRLWRWRPALAVLMVSTVFAALHAWNTAVTPLGLVNIFLGGVLLSLAYARHARLWLPIGLHLGWNLMSGPVLGYPVSGYAPESTLLLAEGGGHELLTGGAFGLEGSVWMTAAEALGIAVLWRRSGSSPEIPDSSTRYEGP